MKNEMYTFAPLRGRMVVKNKPVKEVFGRCPHKQPDKKVEHEVPYSDPRTKSSVAEVPYNRDIDEQWHGKMDLGKVFHETVLKHPDGFFAIGNIILFHC